MAEYDSILKEKKKYEEPQPVKNNGPKPFPWFKIDLLCITLLLIISYVFYYTIILNPEQIFLNDLKKITDKYQNIFVPLKLNQLNNNEYNLKGTISLNDKNYNFTLDRIEENIQLAITLNEKKLNYYISSNQQYIKVPSFKEQYIKLGTNDYYNILHNLSDYLTNNLPEDKFIKKFYLNGTNPIVESNLILNNEDLKKATGLNTIKDSYEILFTFKNHALTNEIISMKTIINNLTTNKRSVILYENGYLTYKDDNQSLKFQLEEKNDDFTLKIYQEDTLFSVITGTKKNNSYQYMYQVIDKIYNITLNITEENNSYLYEIESNIEKDGVIVKPKMSINLKYHKEFISENTEMTDTQDYKQLTEEEKKQYGLSLEEIIGDLREFINKHK